MGVKDGVGVFDDGAGVGYDAVAEDAYDVNSYGVDAGYWCDDDYDNDVVDDDNGHDHGYDYMVLTTMVLKVLMVQQITIVEMRMMMLTMIVMMMMNGDDDESYDDADDVADWDAYTSTASVLVHVGSDTISMHWFYSAGQ